MVELSLEEVAKQYLLREKSAETHLQPPPIRVFIEWRESIYIGRIRVVVPDYSPEIVSLKKSSKPLSSGLLDAIRKLDPERLNLKADEPLDLAEEEHVVRWLENRLTELTPQQKSYVLEHSFLVYR